MRKMHNNQTPRYVLNSILSAKVLGLLHSEVEQSILKEISFPKYKTVDEYLLLMGTFTP